MQSQQIISVQVDDRESRSAVLDALKEQDGVKIEVVRLSVGDYLIDDLFLFERKTLIDLAGSIKDGRLFSQGLRLVGSPQRSALILDELAGIQGIGPATAEMIRWAVQEPPASFGSDEDDWPPF